MVKVELSDYSTGRLYHSNTKEAEENYFKHNFIRMMETFKEEMKKSLKEM